MKRILDTLVTVIAVLVSLIAGRMAVAVVADDRLWIRHSGFEQLRRGTAADGGQNLYVSRKGRVQTINRMDFNHDGEIDLLFTQDHNHVYTPDALIYWGSPEGYTSLLPEMWRTRAHFSLLKWMEKAQGKVTRLPAAGGGRAEIADLNGDGYSDLVFCNFMHNYRPDQDAFVYWGSESGFDPANRTSLPAYLASGVAVGDLNGDGLQEIVLANQGDERGESWGFRLHRESYIYWGSPDGYSVASRTSIPTISAVDVALGDFNGDGSADLSFVNFNSREQSVYIYWNDGHGGFSEKKRQVLGRAALQLTESRTDRSGRVPGMQTLLATEMNADGITDLVIAGTEKVVVFYGSRKGFDESPAYVLPTDHCRGVQSADLNEDGRPELIVANQGTHGQVPPSSTIYWASDQGYASEHCTRLPTLGAATVEVAHLNDDGFLDILFGNEHDRQGSDVPSYIYWGGPRGYAAYRRSELTGFGVIGSGVDDLNRDGRPDILLVSHLSGQAGTLPAVIFWGNPDHDYSSASATVLDARAPMEYSAADLDDDGHADLVFLKDNGESAVVWWGDSEGLSAKNRTELPVQSPMSSSVADLNRDGFLDILFTVPAPARTDRHATSIIVWGNSNRFENAKTTEWELSGTATQANTIADLNRDGHLDLVFPLGISDHSEIWWGSDQGYRRQNSTQLPAHGSPHVVAADLDRDDWLDLIFTSGASPSRFTVNTPTIIYWGSPHGFFPAVRTELEGYTALDATVADLNRDGHLDIAMTNYKSDTNRKIPTFIYWGNGGRNYSVKRRTLLKSASGSAIDALDLNRDGWPELVVSNHQEQFDHAAGTDIFWGGPEGFSRLRRSRLPTVGVHLDAMVDAGNAYTREYEWVYESALVEAPDHARFARLHWKAQADLGTSVRFQVRSANDRDQLRELPWSGAKGPESFFLNSGDPLMPSAGEHRWLQYRAVLSSPDGANSVLLTEVAVELTR